MTTPAQDGHEPTIAVGLVENTDSLAVRLEGDYRNASGRLVSAGEFKVTCRENFLQCSGDLFTQTGLLELTPVDPDACLFSIEATIGIDFHWQQKETQTFSGRLTLLPRDDNRLTVINHVSLESYIRSVICSEMRSTSPAALAKAHAVISRSWLLAQLDAMSFPSETSSSQSDRLGERVRWYDRQAHTDFDVCADDHCQRYQGVRRIDSPQVIAAVKATRGQVLTYNGRACDARFSKCCGGISEDFRTAWGDEAVDYLVPVFDGPGSKKPDGLLEDEAALGEYIANPPDVYCNCDDEQILSQVLNEYDRQTEFFRWQLRLEAVQAGRLINDKLGVNLGRIVALKPVERGISGRLKHLRLVGESGSLVVGKELEIRRSLSPSHLYSSAFIVETEGPADKPDAFILKGAGWGHGVGLCQIGAAVMAFEGIDYEEILEHYYPGTTIEQFYE
ncbi:MAG: SpoIID/LytB domain-containing protein, partial [Deltaproteobacteria bacterium]|nr:SpoIID/LytB domain-containing protein [Deltaproteobacteria bacterium]